MEQQTKVCAMCRETVDQAAMTCPHCRSETNYQHHIEIPEDQVIKQRRPLFKAVSFVISAAVVGLVGVFGISLAGFWAGIGFALLAGIVAAAVIKGMGAEGHDKVQLDCDGCGQTYVYQWESDSLVAGKNAHFECESCKQRTCLTVQPTTVAASG